VVVKRWRAGGVMLPPMPALSGHVGGDIHGVAFQGELGADVLSTFRQVTLEFSPRHIIAFGLAGDH